MRPGRHWGLRAASCETNETSLSVGAASSETVATFGGCWWIQRGGVIRESEWDLASPGGLRCAKLSPRSWAAGGSSGVT
eukprot:3311816-Pyramimonas_sp.AAC.1